MNFERISVIGLGYIGLPTAAVLASRGKEVVGVDINHNVVDTINKGSIHIVEPELESLVYKAVNEGFLRATIIPEFADVYIIAVPTPFKDEYKPDLSYVENAINNISPFFKKR